jgi:REP element-mobilizing transposase RayT
LKYNREKHHRRSVRLKGYDYSGAGAYFVTICAWHRECLFGDIVDGVMGLNEYGGIAAACLKKIPDHFAHVDMDYMIVMPNHIHFILIINHPGRGTACRAPTVERFGSPVHGSVPTIIRSYKSVVTKQINRTRNTPGFPVWQRNYHDRIIRNEKELYETRKYIQNNPFQWDRDDNNPMNVHP